jgi:hypothetical protein
MDSVIQFEGTVYENGYGLIAQKVMRDKSLPKQSKLIYAYMCSFAAVGNNGERTAFPSVSLQCGELGMTKDTYYKWRQPLIDRGYIKISKQRQEGAKFDNNVYSIMAVPVPLAIEKTDESEGNYPCPKNSDTVKPCPKKPDTEKPDTEKPDTEKPDTISNSSIIINSINNSSINFDDDDKDFEINNFAFKEFVDYFRDNYNWDNNELFNLIYAQMKKQKVNVFTVKEAEFQARRMEKYGLDKINDYPAYFVGGIIRNRKSKVGALAARRAQKEQEKAAKQRDQIEQGSSTIPFYNWLEARQ